MLSQPLSDRITFKPLRGGRYRCNQTGDITSQPKQYRFSELRRLQHQQYMQQRIVSAPPATRRANRDMMFSEARCPNPSCGRINYCVYSVGVRTCDHCCVDFCVT